MSNGQYTAADQTVNGKVVARAVNKLEKALFHQTVKSEHSTKFLDEALQSNYLQELSLDDPSHAIDRTPLVDEHLLSKAKQVFPKHIYIKCEFNDIYDTDEDADYEEFDPKSK